MGIPQLRNEGVDTTGTGAPAPSFAGWTFAAGDRLELSISTSGYIPTLTTANGFAIAVDGNGNQASVTTNAGVDGASDCGMFVFVKIAVGSTTATDPVPVFASGPAGSCWACEPNSYSGATSGTYESIQTAIVTTATTTIAPPGATTLTANALVQHRVASSNDDSAFNNWTMTGSSGPAAAGPDTGWHASAGNTCSFTGVSGGYATAGGPHAGTSTFALAARQAQITLVMPSIALPVADAWIPSLVHQPRRSSLTTAMMVAGLVGPVLAIPDPSPAPPLSWSPRFPDFAPRPRAAVLAGGTAAPSTAIPDPAAPATSWLPAFPDTVPRARAAPLAAGAIAPVATIPNPGSTPLAWAPQFPDSISRARAAQLASGPIGPATTIPDPPAPPLSWSPSFADRVERPRAARLASGAIAPVKVIPDLSSAPSLGVAVWREKANTTTPNTGTLTTLPVYPGWAGSTGYTILLDARTTNGGNSYEIATTGTSGTTGTGGPSGSPTPVSNGAITDGSAKWNFVGAGNGAFDTQVAGSMFLVSLGRGQDSTSGTAPRDSNSNAYSLVGSKQFFASFPASTASTWVSALPAVGSVGHTISADWGLGGDFGGDELSIMGIEVVAGTIVQDHSQIEASPVSNVCTSNPVRATGPAVLVCFCWLNGVAHADGFLHTAIAGSGWTLLGFATGLLEIGNGAGQVQGCVIAKTVSSGGTYTANITTAAGEGAIMHLVAIQGSAIDIPSAAGWIPKLPDFAPRARQPVNTGGMVAPVLRIPDVTPLGWAPSFPDRISRIPASPIPGGQAAPVLVLPDITPLSWAPAFPDAIRVRVGAAPGGLVEPALAIPDAPAPALSWGPRFPDAIPRARAAPVEGGLVAPVATLPNAPAPPLSWSPTFADRAPRSKPAATVGTDACPFSAAINSTPPLVRLAPKVIANADDLLTVVATI